VSQITQLASGQINGSDSVTVELGERDNGPARVKITWPLHPTVLDAQHFPDVAAVLVRLFAEAHTALAAIKANRKL
jgi:hypothetical protein